LLISIVIISKDELALGDTLAEVTEQASALQPTEVIVVDASQGRLDAIRDRFPAARWLAYEQPAGISVTIAHQRNIGVGASQGEVIVFTDAGCIPGPDWLLSITRDIVEGVEHVTCGVTLSPSGDSIYDRRVHERSRREYAEECPTINMAFRREVYDAVGSFDENFQYGSDVDFSWRIRDGGYRISVSRDASVTHEWGDRRRQLRRSYSYGQGRARLYLKHRHRIKSIMKNDPIAVAYPLFILGLPLAAKFKPYPFLLLWPIWRNRKDHSAEAMLDHLVFGIGVLRVVWEFSTGRRHSRRMLVSTEMRDVDRL
jgi:glycosyltransferase involved in cell wall biosynthesis